MKHVIPISGTIGWDVLAEDVRKKLKEANGEEIVLDISSPGGSVFEGLTIFNLIKEYEGKKTARINGLAASMASYIPLATDSVIVEENSVFMIHNAWGFSMGDHRDMKKTAALLERLSGLLSKAYVNKTGKSSKEIEEMMDEETFLFGSEIVDAGFGDELIEAEKKEDREDAVLSAMIKLDEAKAQVKDKERQEDLQKAAALLSPKEFAVAQQKDEAEGAVHKTAPEGNNKPQGEERMSLEQMMQEDPGIKAEVEKLVAESKGEKEPEKIENPSEFAMDILSSAHYPDTVKAIAKKVIKGEQTQANLEILVAAADMLVEKKKSQEAQAESDEIGATPGEQHEPKSEAQKTVDAVKAHLKQTQGGK